MPGRFEALSKQMVGEVIPFNELNEEYVVTKYIQMRLNAGITPGQFALAWNQGDLRPCSAGVNRYGIAYDSCKYQQKVLAVLER